MKRVVVLGAPGVGKTTFSQRLSEKTGLPVFHLDFYFHAKATDYEHNKEAWVKFNEDIARKPEWITDGNYRPTLPARVAAADTIIFLDYPRWRSLKGVFYRRIKHHKKPRGEMPVDWKERMNWPFLKFVWDFNKQYKQDLLAAVSSKPIVMIKNPKDAQKYIDYVSRAEPI